MTTPARQRLIDVNVGAGAPGTEPEPDFNLGAALEARGPERISGGGRRDQSILDLARMGPQGGRPFPRPVRQGERQRVQAAVAFHLGGKLPGIEWTKAVDPIADKFITLVGDNPALLGRLESDVNTLFALTDAQLAARIAQGEPVSELGDVFDAILEVAWEVGATDLAARLNAEKTDALAGAFDALTLTEAMRLAMPETAGDVAPGQIVLPDGAKAQTFQTLFDVAGAWSYSPEARTLVVTMGAQTVGVETRPGFDPENHLDVMAEVVAAQADGRIRGGELTGDQGRGVVDRMLGVAHDIGHWLDEHPGVRTTVDETWEAMARLTLNPEATQRSLRGEDEGPLARAADRLRDEKGEMTTESVRLASLVPLPEEAIIATLARMFVSESPGQLTSKDALALAADAVAENRSQLEAEYESLTAEELLTELEADIEGRSPLGEAIEAGLGKVVMAMEWWDNLAHFIGVNVIDSIGTALQAGEALSAGDIGEGFTRIKALAELEEFGTTASEYFGLEGSLADAVDLTVSIGFDPVNLIFPGAKGLRAMSARALTNPERYAGIYLQMGQFPKVAKQIAGGTGNRGVLGVLGMSGLDDPEIIDLMRLARDPEATVGQVNAVWTRALHKDWLGEGPMRAVRHSTVEGMGRMLDSIAAGKLSPEHMDTVMKFFSRAATGRTFRLGENRAMDQFGDLLVQFFPGDPERAAGLYIRAAEARMAAGDDLALAGVTQAAKEQARRAAFETGGTIQAIEGVDDIRSINQNLHSIEEALTQVDQLGLDETAAAGLREELKSMHAAMSRRVTAARPKIVRAEEKRRLANNQLKKAAALEGDMAANAARNVMAAEVYRLYDEVAQEINKQFGREVVPIAKGKVNPLAPDVPVRDWSEVTGIKKLIVGDDPDLSLMMGLSVDDADLARQADAVGMFNRSQRVLLPASPYEVLLYQKLGGDEGALRRASQALRNQFTKKVMRGMRLAFGANLLINPLTAGKVTYDETFRFLAKEGEVGKFLHASAAGTPVVGGALDDLVRRVPKFRSKYGDAVVNPWALQHRRNVGGWSADDFADYGWVERPARRVAAGQMSRAQYREQVERWVNGSLLNDRRFREYARWVDSAETLEDGTKLAPQGFIEWWEQGDGVVRPGKADANPTHITIRDQVTAGTELTANDAFNILHRVFDNWLNLVVDESARPLMRDQLLAAARGARRGFDVTKDARLLNAVSQVPGLSGQTGFGSRVWNVFFGAPSGRRAGVFYEHYFDEAFDILTARHGERVLTTERLMEFAGVDKGTAEFWLKQGSENATVAKLIAETGARTEGQIAARAAAYAERRSDDLMYRFTATSLAGRGVESGLVMPFARAQVDFLSWWSDHLMRPMTTRFTLEQRARMPGVVQDLLGRFERIPINARAWAKYSHLVAAQNNDQESVLDQTIDNLTFLPLHFDSEFLLDVSPQLGPMPSWLIDVMVDKDFLGIGEELGRHLEALFPALAFTELEDDIPGEFFNRVLPSSRRSLRDFTVGQMRAGYALFGNDIHTDPGLMGTMANIIADNKVPAATGDFQAALASEFLAENIWNVVPGSDEWDAAIREIAVQGAVEANRAEWSQDWKDRVSPVTGYDREYRSTRAFEGLFDDASFGLMVESGAFQANDLLETDGQPRIQAVWEKYQRGEANQDELVWLDDRLTTAYFESGRVEVLPGFTLRDYLHLKHPELSVNLISKNEDSGIPVRSPEHGEFKSSYINELTGRIQNVPPGETGRDIIREARRKGWIVSRPIEDWATDASVAVYKSAQRALRGVWERVSHRTWQEGTKKAIEDKRFSLPRREALILARAGLDVEAGTTFTYAEFHAILDDFDERFDVDQPVLLDTLQRGAVHGQLAKHNDEFGLGFLEELGEADRELSKLGIDSVEDWPEGSKEVVRRKFTEAINLGYTTVKDYNQEMAGMFGPLDYAPPTPPPVAELESGIIVSGEELGDVQVIDGDTLSLMMADGPMRIRIVGINAPEVTQEGYQQARTNLEEVVAGASEIVFGVYKPELFGLTQMSAPGERRLLAWLYIDGTPLYDPAAFTPDNPRGAAVGGSVLDLQDILRRSAE